jgi:hypothetical protein
MMVARINTVDAIRGYVSDSHILSHTRHQEIAMPCLILAVLSKLCSSYKPDHRAVTDVAA